MKKKLLSLLLLSALVLSMTACGGDSSKSDFYVDDEDEIVEDKDKDDDKDENEDKDEDDTDKPAETKATEGVVQTIAPVVTEAETTTESVVTEPPVQTQSLVIDTIEKSYYENEWCYLSAKDESNNYKYYIYNKESNKLVEVSDSIGNDVLSLTYISDSGKLGYSGSKIYNLETGEEIFAVGENGICNIACTYTDSFVIVSLEEKFEGNVYSIGVMDGNGEWIYPMSSDYAVCKELSNLAKIDVSAFSSDYIYIEEKNICYYFPDNKVVTEGDLYNMIDNWYNGYGSNTILGVTDKYIYTICWYDTESDVDRVYKYDIKSGVKTMPIDVSVDGILEIKSGDSDWLWAAKRASSSSDVIEKIMLYTDEFKTISEFDLSAISSEWRWLGGSKDKLALVVYNSADVPFITVIGNDGTMLCEPTKFETRIYDDADTSNIYCYGRTYNKRVFIKDNIVINLGDSYDKDGFVFNIDTCEFVYSDKEYKIVGYSEAAGMLIVEAKNSDGEEGYYFADPADPKTLINPFELAE